MGPFEEGLIIGSSGPLNSLAKRPASSPFLGLAWPYQADPLLREHQYNLTKIALPSDSLPGPPKKWQ